MLGVAVAAENAALRKLGENALLRLPERRPFPEAELFRCRISVMEMQAVRRILATDLAGHRGLEVAPPVT